METESQRQDATARIPASPIVNRIIIKNKKTNFVSHYLSTARLETRARTGPTSFGLSALAYFAFLTGSFLEEVSLLVVDSAAGLELSSDGLALSSDLAAVLPDFA